MKTPKLDKEIEWLEWAKNGTNWNNEREEQLIEFKEIKKQLSINNVMQAKPEKTKMKHCLLCEGKGHYYSPSLLRVVKCCKI